MRHLRAELGHLRANLGHLRADLGYLRTELGHLSDELGRVRMSSAKLGHLMPEWNYFGIVLVE